MSATTITEAGINKLRADAEARIRLILVELTQNTGHRVKAVKYDPNAQIGPLYDVRLLLEADIDLPSFWELSPEKLGKDMR